PAYYSTLDDILFTGSIAEGSGVIYYEWQITDGTNDPPFPLEKQGQRVQFRDANIALDPTKTYTVTLQVTGEECPVTRMVSKRESIQILRGYFPAFARDSAFTNQNNTEISSANTPNMNQVALYTADLTQVDGLSGTEQNGQVTLQWVLRADDSSIDGYHVYSESMKPSSDEPMLLATLPRDVTGFTVDNSSCGSIYYITAFNADGESLPSTSSYYTMPCP
ncbi:MAG: fibronectin type III domain-containing protein, partial [Caldilineaceae bacterium]|nr:fibronectin type III domain-containing protein [Caldilineaceae bacterium]